MTSLIVQKKEVYKLSLDEVSDMKHMAQKLLETGHYQKLGMAGICAVIQMARALNVDEIMALNGGLFPVDGKVEMDGRMMMMMIRQAGHSVTKDPSSTEDNIILKGRRADNGDTWSESFGTEDAKRAGLINKQIYQKYGKTMFVWRALSALARFLFADVIKGTYVRGEIDEDLKLDQMTPEQYEDMSKEKVEAKRKKVKDIALPGAESVKQISLVEQPKSNEIPPGNELDLTEQEIAEYLLKNWPHEIENFRIFMEKIRKQYKWTFRECIGNFQADSEKTNTAFMGWLEKQNKQEQEKVEE